MCTLSVKAIIITDNTTITCLRREKIPVTAAALLRFTIHNKQWESRWSDECAHIHKLLFHTDKLFRQISLLVMRLGVAADKARAQERTETFKCNVTWGISSLVTYRLLFPLVTHTSRGVRVSLPSSRPLIARVLCLTETYNKSDFLGAYFHGSAVSTQYVPGTERQETAGSSQTLWG